MTQQQVAEQIWDYLTSRGWTKQSVSALLGNMQSESEISADSWESGLIGNMSGGYGLVQWTPATKYINWAQSNGLVYQNVISQCKRLEWEVVNSQQFYNPNMTFAQFTKSTQSPEALADIFIRYYERPFNPNQPARGIQARYWFELLKGNNNTEEVEMYIIQTKDTGRCYITNGVDIRHIKTTRVLAAYTDKFGIKTDIMYQGEVDKEFGDKAKL
ncbi:MAG: hypothetical protein IKG63_05670 [Streptococcus sp.]|nr:hypothetical protein [Streptococcus sp.]